MKYTPETPWEITEDGSLVYNLKQTGWRKGNSIMENDISVNVNAPDYLRCEIARIIQRTLNAEYPVETND